MTPELRTYMSDGISRQNPLWSKEPLVCVFRELFCICL